MQNIGATLTAGVPRPFQVKGTVLQIISSGQSAGLTVQFMQGGQVAYTVTDILTGWKLAPKGGFDAITIESATGDTVSAIVTNGDIDVQILTAETTVTNTAANPVPVSVAGASLNITATDMTIGNTAASPVPVQIIGEPVPVSGAVTLGNNGGVNVPVQGNVTVANTNANPAWMQGTVTVGNTNGDPVPVTLQGASVALTLNPQAAAVSITDLAPGPVGIVGALLVAAAARIELRVRNAGAGNLALTGSAAETFANATVILAPGDLWIETTAPNLAWYAVSDTGTTAAVQEIA